MKGLTPDQMDIRQVLLVDLHHIAEQDIELLSESNFIYNDLLAEGRLIVVPDKEQMRNPTHTLDEAGFSDGFILLINTCRDRRVKYILAIDGGPVYGFFKHYHW